MQLIETSVRRPVFATMLIAVLVVFGIFAYPRIGAEQFPSVDFPVVTATMIYPGADPETMEQKVAEPVEEALQSMNGIRRMTSQNFESVSAVILEFELDIDPNVALQEARDKISSIQIDLPEGMEPPIVQRINTGSSPVISVALSGDIGPRELTQIADKRVKQALQRIKGVGTINLLGGRERQIQIDLQLDKLKAFGLTVQDVEQAIAAQNFDLPAGLIERSRQELTLKTHGEVETLDGLGDILISGIGGAQIRVRDVATITDGLADKRSHGQVQGKSAVALEILKQGDANVVKISEKIREELERLRPELEERGVTMAIPMDNSRFTQRSIEDVQIDLAIGSIFTIIIIFVFLHNIPSTLIAALAIPTSVVGTFAAMQALGFSFNYMTMLALSLSVGLLVDDAIVVIENIYRHLQMGKSGMRAALDGTREIAFAVLATTLSIVAVFIPVAFMSGIVGRFFFQFGITVAVAVVISTFVSFTLTPMLSARLLQSEENKGVLSRAFDRLMGGIETAYGYVIRTAIRFPWLTVLSGILLLVGSVLLLSKVPNEFLPAEDRSEFNVVVETPSGTSLAETTEAVGIVSDEIREKLPGVRLTFATVSGGQQGKSNEGRIRVVMTSSKQRSFTQQEAQSWLRNHLANAQGASVRVEEIPPVAVGTRNQPIQFVIQGNDLDELGRISTAVANKLKETPGFVDVDTSLRSGKPELAVEVDRERAADLGVPLAVVATTIRSLISQDPTGTFKSDGELHDIVVRLPKSERNALNRLEQVEVRAVTGNLVQLSSLVRITPSSGPSNIERYNRQRMVVVVSELEGIPLGDAAAMVEEIAKPYLSDEIRTSWLGDAEVMKDTQAAMGTVILLAGILVYMILAAQFNSFTHPVVVMVSLPFSLMGAFGATYLAGMSINIFSFIGIVMLMGLVTKAAILMVDLTNQLREEGVSVEDALERAGRTRLRPIIMTTASTIVGMIPIAMAWSEGGESRAPMGVCVIGGMVIATLLTLVFIPSVYLLVARVLEHLGLDAYGEEEDDLIVPAERAETVPISPASDLATHYKD